MVACLEKPRQRGGVDRDDGVGARETPQEMRTDLALAHAANQQCYPDGQEGGESQLCDPSRHRLASEPEERAGTGHAFLCTEWEVTAR